MKEKIKGYLVQPVNMTPTDWLVDVVIAAGAFGFGLLQLTLSVNLFLPDDFTRRLFGIRAVTPSAYAIIFTLITCVPLIFRRRFPWIVFLLSTTLWVVFENLLDITSLSMMGPLVALFTLAYERGRGEAIAAGTLLLIATIIWPLMLPTSTLTNLLLLQNASITIAVALAGYALNARQRFLEQAQARAQEALKLSESEKNRALEAERTRESEAARRVEEERVRIARELHDITAHSLSAVNIQASVAERLIDQDPRAAKEAMDNVRQVTHDALDEIRAMVGVLRTTNAEEQVSPADEDRREPTKGTDALAELRTYLEANGITCMIDDASYQKERVPAYIDIALFGIAREATTNILRHAHATKASITLSSTDDCVRLHIEDNGQGIEDAIDMTCGHGLEGMRERVSVLDGSFSAGNRSEGGFQIDACIPLGAVSEGRRS